MFDYVKYEDNQYIYFLFFNKKNDALVIFKFIYDEFKNKYI